MVGESVSHYRLIEKLGSGGMGVVYKAEDTRLNRTVALKFLPDKWGASDKDPERRRRLVQEARAASALDHPNVVTIYDVDEADGRLFIAMQLVAGKPLRDLIGSLKLREALGYAVQIAKGLSAAHAKGIIHRDLKPENVLVADNGVVKILDFGLAKLSEPSGFDSFESPTREQHQLTEEGHVLGTPSYMSPEQASERKVDARTDIFSFGSVLFEMLSGKRAFPGNTFAETAASLLEREPDWEALPPYTPPLLLRLLKRCLRKNVEERLQYAADAALEIEEILPEVSGGGAAARAKRSWKSALAVSGVAALLLLAIFIYRSRGPAALPADARQPRFQLTLPRGVAIPGLGSGASFLTVSPNGEQVSFVGRNDQGRALYLRERDELDARPLPGTEGASCPFFSPDGRWVGFGAGGKLKKMALDGGAVLTIADAPQLRGASWGEDGTIVFSSAARGLLQVSADGGEIRELTKPDPDRDYDHRWPNILPGGQAVLFVVMTKAAEHEVAILDLATGSTSVLVKDASYPRYSQNGCLLYARAGVLYGAAFDVERLQATGAALPVLEGVAMSSSPGGTGSSSGAAYYDVSREGSLVFSPRESRFPKRSLVWVDRKGRFETLDPVARAYRTDHALAPDGRRLAVGVWEADFQGTYILDMEKGAWARVNDVNSDGDIAWMLDSEGLLTSQTIPIPALMMVSSRGAVQPERLYEGEAAFPVVAPDASAILFCNQPQPAQWDIWRLPLKGPRVPEPFLATTAPEVTPSFSPDGRFVAYRSNESGRAEIWVRPYPGPGAARMVSSDTGVSPKWSRDGKEIFFLSRGRLMAAPVRTHPEFSAEPPKELFPIPEDIETTWRFYDVTPDGKRFVMIRKDPFELRPLELVMIPNWVAELEARMAGSSGDR
jgi:serine/threonine-protein kinase